MDQSGKDTLGKHAGKRKHRSNSLPSDPHKRSRTGSELLHSAKTGDLNAIKRHHELNGDMSFADYDDRTALHVATAEGHEHVVKYLLEKCKVNPDLQDRWGNTPYGEAFRTDNQPIAQLISQYMNKQKGRKTDPGVPVELEDRQDLVAEYVKALDEGQETHNTLLMIVIGPFGVGKTSLTRNLLEMPLEDVKQTNGIDVHEHKCFALEDDVWELKGDFDFEEHAFQRIARVAKQTSISETQELSADVDRDEACNRGMFEDEVGIPDSASAQPVSGGKSIRTIIPENVMKYSDAEKLADEKVALPVSIWDFGGHCVFNATHQLFHTPRAVYLLVLDMTKDLEELATDEDCPHGSRDKSRTVESYCKFWMHSIISFVGTQNGEPPVILVGTHRDELIDGSDDFVSIFFDRVRNIFPPSVLKHIQKKTFALNNKSIDRSKLDELRKYIVDVAMEQTNAWDIPSPAKWIPLENELLKQKLQKHLTFDEICKIDQDNECPIGNKEEIKSFLSIQHLKRTLIYFNENGLDRFVILSVQWFIDAFKQIITSDKFCKVSSQVRSLRSELDSDGILRPKLIDDVWRNDFIKHKEMLLKYMVKLGILAKLKEYDEQTGDIIEYNSYYVPSLMQTKCDYDLNKLMEMNHTPPLVIIFQNGCVSPTLFDLLSAASLARWPVLKLEGKRMLYDDIGIYQMDKKHMFMLRRLEDAIEIIMFGITNEPVNRVQSHCLRRYIEMVVQHELGKYRLEHESWGDCYCIGTRCNKTDQCGKEKIPFTKLPDARERWCLDTMKHMIDIEHVKRHWILDTETVQLQLSDCLSEETLDDYELNRLSSAIGKNWEHLAAELLIPGVVIEHIQSSTHSAQQKIYHMLCTWRNQKKGRVTLHEFVKAVNNTTGNVTIAWDVIENIKDKSKI